MEFAIPLHPQSLQDHRGDRYYVKEVEPVSEWDDKQLRAALRKVQETLTATPLALQQQPHTFDLLYACLLKFGHHSTAIKSQLALLIRQTAESLAAHVNKFLASGEYDEDPSQAVVPRSSLKAASFLLVWLVQLGLKEETAAAVQQAKGNGGGGSGSSAARRGGGGGASRAASRKQERFDDDFQLDENGVPFTAAQQSQEWWSNETKELVVALYIDILRIPHLERLWNLPLPEEDFVLLFSKSACALLDRIPASGPCAPLENALCTLCDILVHDFNLAGALGTALLDRMVKSAALAPTIARFFARLYGAREQDQQQPPGSKKESEDDDKSNRSATRSRSRRGGAARRNISDDSDEGDHDTDDPQNLNHPKSDESPLNEAKSKSSGGAAALASSFPPSKDDAATDHHTRERRETTVAHMVEEFLRCSSLELARSSEAVKNVETFLLQTAAQQPRLIARSMDELLELLDASDSYVLRNAVLQCCGRLLLADVEAAETAGDRTTSVGDSLLDEEARRVLYAQMLQRVEDISSYTRSKTLQVWAELVSARTVPSALFGALAEKVVKRLRDKAAVVRKYAVALLTAMLRFNPFGPSLPCAAMRAALERVGADDELTAQNLRDALAFVDQLHAALSDGSLDALICDGQAAKSDTVEAVQFFTTCAHFGLDDAAHAGMLRILPLIWSKEAGIREAIVGAFYDVHLRPAQEEAQAALERDPSLLHRLQPQRGGGKNQTSQKMKAAVQDSLISLRKAQAVIQMVSTVEGDLGAEASMEALLAGMVAAEHLGTDEATALCEIARGTESSPVEGTPWPSEKEEALAVGALRALSMVAGTPRVCTHVAEALWNPLLRATFLPFSPKMKNNTNKNTGPSSENGGDDSEGGGASEDGLEAESNKARRDAQEPRGSRCGYRRTAYGCMALTRAHVASERPRLAADHPALRMLRAAVGSVQLTATATAVEAATLVEEWSFAAEQVFELLFGVFEKPLLVAKEWVLLRHQRVMICESHGDEANSSAEDDSQQSGDRAAVETGMLLQTLGHAALYTRMHIESIRQHQQRRAKEAAARKAQQRIDESNASQQQATAQKTKNGQQKKTAAVTKQRRAARAGRSRGKTKKLEDSQDDDKNDNDGDDVEEDDQEQHAAINRASGGEDTVVDAVAAAGNNALNDSMGQGSESVVDKLEQELGVAAMQEENEAEWIAHVMDNELIQGAGTFLGAYGRFVAEACEATALRTTGVIVPAASSTGTSSSSSTTSTTSSLLPSSSSSAKSEAAGGFLETYVARSAVLALCKFMLCSRPYCEQHLRLLFTLFLRSGLVSVRSLIAVALGDLSARYPNLLEPWTTHFNSALQDESVTVRKNALMVLTHMTLNDMMKAKTFVSAIAARMEDSDARIRALSRTFFSELAQKNNELYNVLPDILSTLSSAPKSEVSSEAFRRITRYLFSFLQKERQVEQFVEKLCHRFQVLKTTAASGGGGAELDALADLVYCISILRHNDKSVRRLMELGKCYSDMLAQDAILQPFLQLAAKIRRSAKDSLKVAVDEWEAHLLAWAAGKELDESGLEPSASAAVPASSDSSQTTVQPPSSSSSEDADLYI